MEYAEQEGDAQTDFTFSATLINNTLSTQSYALAASAPTGWTVSFTPAGETTRVAALELETRINELLERMGMTAAADRRASTYSKGMKQRLGIADILLKDPDVLILDEPTNGVDPEGIRELTALIRELADRDGRTILISSHQLHQIQQICDRVGIFVKGRLAACGRIEELAEQLEKENGYCFAVAAQPGGAALEETLKSVEGVTRVDVEDGLCVVRASADVRAAAAKRLIERDFQLTYLQKRGGDLDDIYAKYFEKAGEINAGKRKDGHRARQTR